MECSLVKEGSLNSSILKDLQNGHLSMKQIRSKYHQATIDFWEEVKPETPSFKLNYETRALTKVNRFETLTSKVCSILYMGFALSAINLFPRCWT